MKSFSLIFIFLLSACSSYQHRHLTPVKDELSDESLRFKIDFLGDRKGELSFLVNIKNTGDKPITIDREFFILRWMKVPLRTVDTEARVVDLNRTIDRRVSELDFERGIDAFHTLASLPLLFDKEKGDATKAEMDKRENELKDRERELERLYWTRDQVVMNSLPRSYRLSPGEQIEKWIYFDLGTKENPQEAQLSYGREREKRFQVRI